MPITTLHRRFSHRLAALMAGATIILAAGVPAAAQTPAVSIVAGTGQIGTDPDTNGWRFQAGTQMDVVDLGVWDENGDGLPSSVTVALWSDAGTLLGSVVVPAGTVAPLDNGFRYVTLASAVRLTAGTFFRVAATPASGMLTMNRLGDTTYAAPIVYDWPYWNSTSNTVLFPDRRLSNPGPGFFGPNFHYLDMTPPTFGKAFAPASVSIGGISTLTYTIGNLVAEAAATNLAFTDVLPTGINVAAIANAATSCAGGLVTATPGSQTITLSGASLATGQTCTVTVDVVATAAGAHASTSGALTSSLGSSTAATATLTGVNLPPTIAAMDNQILREDGAPAPVTVTVGDDVVSPDALTVSASSSNPAIVANEAISVSGTGATRSLTFAVTPNASGATTIIVNVSDGVSTSQGTFHVSVTAVNDAPSFAAGPAQDIVEDAGPQMVTGWATNRSAGPPDESLQSLTFEIVANTNPSLFSTGPSIDGVTGTLTYTPAANAHGTANISVRLRDDGGTADDGVNVSSAATFTITVAPVNDPPSFHRGADQTVAEDAGPQVVPGWATAISAGPANESGQQVMFDIIANSTPSLFSAGPSVDASGTLTYTPAANAHGSATVLIRLRDDGGTANNGLDEYGGTPSILFTVTAVNDAPTVAAIDAQAMPENGTLTPLAFAIDDEDTDVNALTVTATSSNLTLVPQAALVLGGSGGVRTIAATPLANLSGQTTITITVSDGDQHASASFVLTVLASSAPQAPRDLTASARGGGVHLAWRAAGEGSPAVHYVVESSRTPFGTSLPATAMTASETALDLPLSLGTYFFRVRAANSGGLSEASNEAVATVGVGGTPGAPTGLQVGIAGSRVSLGWQRPSTAPAPTAYRVEVGSTTGLSDVAVVDTGATATSAAGSLPDGAYVARVRAAAGAALGAASNEVAFTVGETVCTTTPTAPVLLSPLVATDLVTLTWLAPAAGGATSYRLSAGTAPGVADLLLFDTRSTATALSTITPGAGTYYVSVQAENGCGFGPTSNSVAVVVPPAAALPNAPRGAVAAVSGRRVTLSWTPPAGGAAPAYYLVEAGSAPGLANYGAFPFGAAMTSVAFDGIPPATYFVRVRAITAGGAGAASNEMVVVVQ